MKTKATTLDLTVTWEQALPYIIILIESHAKKSYFDCGADEGIRECLSELHDQHRQLAKFYKKNNGKDGAQ